MNKIRTRVCDSKINITFLKQTLIQNIIVKTASCYLLRSSSKVYTFMQIHIVVISRAALYFQKSSLFLIVLGLATCYSFKIDGNPLYEISCAKQCGSYFGRCYKNCYDGEKIFQKRNRDCLDTCLLRLTTCHHFCGQ